MVTIVSLIIGFLAGILASSIVGFWFLLDRFLSSPAGSCVKETVEATKKIIESQNRTGERTRYRDSLGVIIDTLDQTWNSSEFREDEWPPLINFSPKELCLANENGGPDPGADRRALFNKHVNPVRENINN